MPARLSVPGREVLTGRAPAKLNLVLEVTGKRGDGYHEIDTVLQMLELADDVAVSLGGAEEVRVSGPFADGTPADRGNLAWRAAEELARRCGRTTEGLGIRLDKQIPAAGGLGGGASDAVTVLRLLQRAWRAPEAAVQEAADAVGSDEAFFLAGGTARATGRGERVVPLSPLPRHGVVLFIPRDTIERKTARMFAELDRHPFDTGSVSAAFAARPPAALTGADIYNAFERAAFDVFPGLHGHWEELEARLREPVRLAGAGPTLFWIGPEERMADVAQAVRGTACTIIPTATAGP
jgi:4-diphosphocytidyl-2-C-methyl-D-erythritol kinase